VNRHQRRARRAEYRQLEKLDDLLRKFAVRPGTNGRTVIYKPGVHLVAMRLGIPYDSAYQAALVTRDNLRALEDAIAVHADV
jgi:hypothetical protein